MKTVPIALSVLVPDPAQPRTAESAAELDCLAESIRGRGQLLPLRVRPADAAGRHVIVSGHRRYAALLKLGVPTADCVVADGPPDEAAVLAEQLAENLLREDLNPIDEAEGYRRYIALRQTTAARAAAELHVTASRLSRLLPLLDLPADVRRKVAAGVIPPDTAYHLARLPAGDDRNRLLDRAAAGALTRDAAARAAKAAASPRTAAAPVARVTCKLPGGRSLTVTAEAVHLESLIETLEDVLKEARKARSQGWDVTTLAKVCRDRAAAGGGA